MTIILAQCLYSAVGAPLLQGRFLNGAFAAEHPWLVARGDPSDPEFLDVPVDHFAAESTTWPLKYWVATSTGWNAAAPGPIFIEMPSEGPGYGAPSVRNGSLIDRFNGVGIALEHRFFGSSVPLNDSSTKALDAYLSVEQNLADIVVLLGHVKRQLGVPRGTPVVSMGGSYAGASAAWIRFRYPNDVAAALAASPPIRATLDFRAYDASNAVALSTPDSKCRTAAVATMRAIDGALNSDPATKGWVFGLFNASRLLATPQGLTDFMYGIADAAATPVQYGSKHVLCDALAKLPAQPTPAEYVTFFAGWVLKQYGGGYFSECFYDSECMRSAVAGSAAQSARSWYHLKCHELGYLQTATPVLSAPSAVDAKPPRFVGNPEAAKILGGASQTARGIRTKLNGKIDANPSVRPSGLTVGALAAQCAYIFARGAAANESAAIGELTSAFNGVYGGANPERGLFSSSSNVAFFDFSDDPWKSATVLTNTTKRPSLPVHLFTHDGCGHCGAGCPQAIADRVLELQEGYVASWLGIARIRS